MITFKNVSSSQLYAYIYSKEVDTIISDNNLKTVDEVIKFMKLNPNYNWYRTVKRIKELEKIMDKYNKKGKLPEIYLTNDYKDKTLKYTDNLNNGNILLLKNPTNEKYEIDKYIEENSIETLKQNLSLTKANGTNYFKANIDKIGNKKIIKIVNSINLYNEQIIRQSKITLDRKTNIFNYQKEEKLEQVNKHYEEIIIYLIKKTKSELIWGNLSNNQKEKYLKSINNTNKLEKLIKQRMIDIISNYTTLDELKNIENNKKILNRFIKH